jgi:hypothetical protein
MRRVCTLAKLGVIISSYDMQVTRCENSCDWLPTSLGINARSSRIMAFISKIWFRMYAPISHRKSHRLLVQNSSAEIQATRSMATRTMRFRYGNPLPARQAHRHYVPFVENKQIRP